MIKKNKMVKSFKKSYNLVVSVISQFPKFVSTEKIVNDATPTIYHLYDFEYITSKEALQIRRIYLPYSIYQNKSPLFIAISTRLPSNIFIKSNILKRILCQHCVKVAKKIPKLQNMKLYYDSFQLNKKCFKQHIFKNCKNITNPEPTFLPENIKL